MYNLLHYFFISNTFCVINYFMVLSVLKFYTAFIISKPDRHLFPSSIHLFIKAARCSRITREALIKIA